MYYIIVLYYLFRKKSVMMKKEVDVAKKEASKRGLLCEEGLLKRGGAWGPGPSHPRGAP